jgi:hypothetical protein
VQHHTSNKLDKQMLAKKQFIDGELGASEAMTVASLSAERSFSMPAAAQQNDAGQLLMLYGQPAAFGPT